MLHTAIQRESSQAEADRLLVEDQAMRRALPFCVELVADGVTPTVERFATRADAEAALCAFRAANWTNPLAFASIWDRMVTRLDVWRGGVVFGPKDTRHPIERLYTKAIRAGAPVTVITERGTARFNQGAAA